METDPSKQPQFSKTIDDLVSFSTAVTAFKRHYDDLQNHIDHIHTALDSLSQHTTLIPPNQPPLEPLEPLPEVQQLCALMCTKGLRKYIYTNITNRAKLISELPTALKQAKDPARFVLECIGKFYLQGRKAFSKDSTLVSAREVSLLILESFLLMKIKVEGSSVKNEAESAAIAWRKRLVVEGGLSSAEEMDARGLLLLVGSFGVPSRFKNIDLLDLVVKSGSGEIACALRGSEFLVPLVSGVVESSVKRGLHLKALEVVFTFGVEDKFSASSLLTAFLRKSKELFESGKEKARSPMAFREANDKQLAALSSVLKCLEVHKLDPAKEVPEWEIEEEIVKLKKDNLQLDKEMKEKPRSMSLMEEEILADRLYNPQMKRPRLSAVEASPVASSSYSPLYRDHHSQRDGDRDDISALVSSYLGPSSAFPHRSSLRRSPEYMTPPGGGLGRYVSAYEHMPPNSFSLVPEQRLPNSYSSYTPVPGQRPPRLYSPPIHGQQQQIPFGLQRVYRHSPSEERYSGLSDNRSPRRSPRRNSSLDHSGGM